MRGCLCLTRGAAGAAGAGERGAGRFCPDAPDCDAGNHQFVNRPRCGWKESCVEPGKHALRLVEAAEEEEAAEFEMPGMRDIDPVAVGIEGCARRVQRLRRPTQVARRQRNLGLGNDAPRAGQYLFRTESALRASEESPGTNEVAQLRHGDAPKRESGSVVAQSDPLEGAERITRCQGARGACDQRVHLNPATFVTLTISMSSIKFVLWAAKNQRRKKMATSKQQDKEHGNGHLPVNTPRIVSPQEWEAARLQLLVKEKALTRSRDALAAERRRMPWMVVEKAYEFEGPGGKASLLDLFEGRRQLVVYRAFFEPGVFGWPEHACRRLLPGRRSGRAPVPFKRPRHYARVRLARATERHRTREGADGLDDALVHHDRQLRQRLRSERMARP